MNFLEICKTVRSEAGLSGNGPSSVVSQTGMDLKVVNWVNDAYFDVQSARPNWRWKWMNDGSFNTVTGQQEYDIGTLFSIENLVEDSVSREVTGSPNTIGQLEIIDFETFRQRTAFIPATDGYPIYATILPNGKMKIYPKPTVTHTIRFEYFTPPVLMTNNTDIPALPEKFHRIIVELALMKYSAHDEATATYQDAQANYKKWMRRLEADQLLEVEIAEALA